MPEEAIYYEPRPEHPTPNDWVAPEHMKVARSMKRVRGELVIERHEIFRYSEENPPAWLTGPTRKWR